MTLLLATSTIGLKDQKATIQQQRMTETSSESNSSETDEPRERQSDNIESRKESGHIPSRGHGKRGKSGNSPRENSIFF